MTLTNASTPATAREAAAETLRKFTEHSPEYLQHVANGTIKLSTDRHAFACVGCGWNCCSREIMITTPEYIRIVWKLRRAKMLEAVWPFTRLHIGFSTGLPVLMLDPKIGKNGNYCSFLAPAVDRDGKPLDLALCLIAGAQPNACRIFPLARMRVIDPANPTAVPPLEESIFVEYEHCPGFEPAKPGQVTPPNYKFSAEQTVLQFARDRLNPQLDEEITFFTGVVIDAFIKAGCHAPTEQLPKGHLTEEEAAQLNRLFYPTLLLPPDDLAHDHEAIMHFLKITASLPEKLLRERTESSTKGEREPVTAVG